MKELRPYQSELLNKLKMSVRKKNRRIILQSPTGSGKSIIFSKIISGANKKENSVLFLVHRRQLIMQASSHLNNENIDHGIIMAGVIPNLYENVQLASIDTLRSRCITKEIVPWPRADIIVVDEFHRVGGATYQKILEKYPEALIVGVTATPCRGSGKGLGEFADDLIIGTSISELTKLGFLADVSYMVPFVPKLEKIKVRAGDFVEGELAAVMSDCKLIGDIVSHWHKYANNRKTIAFTVNVAHSLALVEMFNQSGVPAAHIDGKTSQEDRDVIIQDYVSGKYSILSNCAVFIEGFDVPDTSCCILAKPTKSLGLYLQMIGRITRPSGETALVLDHSGNVYRHGAISDEHYWSLESSTIQENDRKKKDPQESLARDIVCGNCGNIFQRQAICPKCGTPLEKTAKDVETAKGELVEFKPKEEKKEKSKFTKQEFYSMLLTQASLKNYQHGWVSHRYRNQFGVWPRGLDGGLMTRTPDFINHMTHLNIKQAKRLK